jgi:pimeloyl-ACP methyl ester carboxylesterase
MFTHHLTSVNGIRLHYVSAGSGKPIVFLHGHPDFWYLWKDQLTYFARTHHVIAPDLRGYNLSDKPPEVADYRIPIVVEDIRSLADTLGLSAVTLVGHDWGAITAWEFAARYPDELERLIIFSTAPLDVIRSSVRDPLQRSRWTYQLMLTSPQVEQILTAGDYYLYNLTVFGEFAQAPPGYFTEADRQAYHEAWSQPGVIRGSVNYYRAAHLLDYFTEAERQAFLDAWTQPDRTIAGERFYHGLRAIDVWGEMRPLPADDFHDDASNTRIEIPTLCIAGEREEFGTSNNAWFQVRVPHGVFRRVADAGHRIIHERSEVVTAYIEGFMEG